MRPPSQTAISRDVVAATANGHEQIVIAGEADAGHHVVGACAARDQRGTLVDHAVPDLARGVVAAVGGTQQRAGETGRELIDL